MDTLVGFFLIDLGPTSSKDPYALRRSGLGIIRIIIEGKFFIKLNQFIEISIREYSKKVLLSDKNFETYKKGIFAVGDICSYPGKLKLILSGFHEVALASVECFKRARPNEKYRFEFTTSSKNIQERLGKK